MNEKLKKICTTIRNDQYKNLTQISYSHDMKMAQIIRQALDLWMQNHEKKKQL